MPRTYLREVVVLEPSLSGPRGARRASIFPYRLKGQDAAAFAGAAHRPAGLAPMTPSRLAQGRRPLSGPALSEIGTDFVVWHGPSRVVEAD